MAKNVCQRCGRFTHQHAVRALYSPMSYNIFRSYPLSPHPPHLDLARRDITSLPMLTFHGRKIVIKGRGEMKYRRHILRLADNDVLGFDTESPPQYSQLPSLVQLASEEMCIMWQLNWKDKRRRCLNNKGPTPFPPLLHSILTSPKVLKVSVCVCRFGCPLVSFPADFFALRREKYVW